jgi:hypothetical protein
MSEVSNHANSEALSKTSLLVPKLKEDGSNWVLYKTRLTDYICGHPGYRRHFTGRAKCPTPPTDDTDPDALEKHEDNMDEFIQKQSAIRLIILGSLPEKLQVQLINISIVHDRELRWPISQPLPWVWWQSSFSRFDLINSSF